MTLGERIEEALQIAGMTVKDLESALEAEGVEGGSYANLHRLKSDKMDRPSAGLLYGIAKTTGVNLPWLVAEDGEPTAVETELAEKTDKERGRLHLRNRVRQRLGSDFLLLGPAERELFLETLARWVMTAPDGAGIVADEAEKVVGWKIEKDEAGVAGIRSIPVDEEGRKVSEPGVEALLELAEDLLWLVNLPVGSGTWGFANAGRERPGQLRDYRLAMLSALRVLMLDRGRGQPLERAAASPLRQLRQWKEGEDAALREALAPGEKKVARLEDDGEEDE